MAEPAESLLTGAHLLGNCSVLYCFGTGRDTLSRAKPWRGSSTASTMAWATGVFPTKEVKGIDSVPGTEAGNYRRIQDSRERYRVPGSSGGDPDAPDQ